MSGKYNEVLKETIEEKKEEILSEALEGKYIVGRSELVEVFMKTFDEKSFSKDIDGENKGN